MKILKTISLIFLLIITSNICFAQKEQIASIYDGLAVGNTDNITDYVDNTVDISINNNQSTYSKAQAEMILKDFFKKHPPQKYIIEKTGNDKGNNTIYSIGKLTMQATGCMYRVFIKMKPKDGHYMLTELRLEK